MLGSLSFVMKITAFVILDTQSDEIGVELV